MGYYPQEPRRGVGAAVAIHLTIYCAVGGAFAYGLHALFAPTQLTNPGLSIYKPPPQTVINYVPVARPPEAEQPVAVAAEPPPDATIGMKEAAPATEASSATKPTRSASTAEKRKRTARSERSRRTRTAKQRRNPRQDYAYQPFFWGGYRPWY
jgi:hypothetical protein